MVIRLHSRTSAAFLAADLKQARVDAVTAAANQAFFQRIGNLQVQASGQGGIRTHGTLAGTPVFETGRFNRSRTCPRTLPVAGSTLHECAHALLVQHVRCNVQREERTGWDSNPRNGYPFTRSPGVCLQPLGHLSPANNLIPRCWAHARASRKSANPSDPRPTCRQFLAGSRSWSRARSV